MHLHGQHGPKISTLRAQWARLRCGGGQKELAGNVGQLGERPEAVGGGLRAECAHDGRRVVRQPVQQVALRMVRQRCERCMRADRLLDTLALTPSAHAHNCMPELMRIRHTDASSNCH